MYLHIGLDKVITGDEILGIFDLDNTTVSKHSRDYLSKAEKEGTVENVCTDLPKSFVVCEKNGQKKVYITQIAPATILKRLNNSKKKIF